MLLDYKSKPNITRCLFIFYLFLLATLITKNIGKEEEKKKKKRSGEET